MKIINYKSGLGNQIYFYLFGKYLEQKYPGQKVYANYLKKFLVAHNGVEIQNVFDLELPPQTLWSKIVAFCCRKLNGIGFNFLKCTDEEYSESAIYFDGYWQDKKYFLDNLKSLRFRKIDLDKTNFELKKSILESESVCLHVRRGDYLSPANKPIYGGICTLDYYKNAIEIAKQKFSHPVFFVFSNDIDWVKANLDVKDAIFITNNQGKNSYLDLYLMTFCKGAIIANSSFSYWGSMLNAQYKDFVIYPKKWWNTIKIPDIFPDSWIGI